MCGIVGEASLGALNSVEWIKNALNAIKHRGPDNEGIWSSEDKKIIFGHRRLSIIDLSNDGNQPMLSECQNYVITFNGEIYNYKEIASKLKKKGIKLKTETDTEVLLNSYKVWDEHFLDQIEGMFAFAISGQKPLYIFKNNSSISFCSELKGLLENPSVERKLSEESFIQYLHQGYASDQCCLVKDVIKLKAGQLLKFNLIDGKAEFKKYFNLPKPLKNEVNDSNVLIEKLEILLKNSIKDQTKADVPLGILLSGGIDSSLITSIASNSNKKINTFTFINDLEKQSDFELNNSRIISKFYSTNHHEIYFGDIKKEIIFEISDINDEPIIDSSFIPTYLITKKIKKYCTVALGGDGGDELFGGYNHYPRLLNLIRIKKILPELICNFVSHVSNSYLPIGFKGRNWLNLLSKNFNENYLDFATYFDTHNNFKIISNFYINNFKNLNYLERKDLSNDDYIYKSTSQDFNNFLVDDILSKNDRSSMANSLELRSPFLDSKVINFAFGEVNSNLKVNNNKKKILLKKLCLKLFPKNFEFEKKKGFSVPIANYFKKKDWINMAQNILLDDNSLFNTNYVSSMFKKSIFNHNNAERIYGLIMFELWRKKNKISIG